MRKIKLYNFIDTYTNYTYTTCITNYNISFLLLLSLLHISRIVRVYTLLYTLKYVGAYIIYVRMKTIILNPNLISINKKIQTLEY